MRVSFLEAQHQKWRRALAGNKVLPTAGSTASRQLLSGYLRHGNAAQAVGPASHAAVWNQVQAHGLAPACLHRSHMMERAKFNAFMQYRNACKGRNRLRICCN